MSNFEHAYPRARFDANTSLIIYEQSSWMSYVRINILISHISFLSMNSYDNPSSCPIWNHYDFFNQNGKQIQFYVLTIKLILGRLAENIYPVWSVQIHLSFLAQLLISACSKLV
jgi:hypothetical protein